MESRATPWCTRVFTPDVASRGTADPEGENLQWMNKVQNAVSKDERNVEVYKVNIIWNTLLHLNKQAIKQAYRLLLLCLSLFCSRALVLFDAGWTRALDCAHCTVVPV